MMMRGNYRRILIRTIACLACWGILSVCVMQRAYQRSRESFLHIPEGYRDLNYPGWLLKQSRIQQPSTPKVLFLGDSVVNGWKASSSEFTVTSRFGTLAMPFHLQTFSFALIGLNPRDYQRICRENVQKGDYVVIQLMPTAPRMNQDARLRSDAYGPASRFLPLRLLRWQIAEWHGRAPSFLLFDSATRFKEMLKQKTIHPVPVKDYVPFSPQNPNANNVVDLVDFANFSKPLDKKSIDGIGELLDVLEPCREKVFFYMTPLNPYHLGKKKLSMDSQFRNNMSELLKLIRVRGFHCQDYILEDRPLLEMSDFLDYAHYTDEGAIKAADRVFADFSKKFLRP